MIINEFEIATAFTSYLYLAKKPEFLDSVKKVSQNQLDCLLECGERNSIYPVLQTNNFAYHPEILEFCQYIGKAGWHILKQQGYNMDYHSVVINSLWCQDHAKFSGQEEHIHGMGSQLSGFYFLETPNESCHAVFHDPRVAKIYAGLPESNIQDITPASNSIRFKPEPGLMMISNSWLPHSFTKNASEQNMKFIHFNLSVGPAAQQSNVEVV
jgi:uncharacterized protein (TIGR02466 family)